MGGTKRPSLEKSNFPNASINIDSGKPPKFEPGDVVSVLCDGVPLSVALYPFDDINQDLRGQIVEIADGYHSPQDLAKGDTIYLEIENIFGIISKPTTKKPMADQGREA